VNSEVFGYKEERLNYVSVCGEVKGLA